MQIIELTEEQFRDYSSLHSKRNIYESVEYAAVHKKRKLQILYLGLVDEDSNLVAATLIIGYPLFGSYKFGYAPRGFLIDFNNEKLVREFTKGLRKYFHKSKYVFIKLDPAIVYRKWDRNDEQIVKDDNYMKLLNSLGYVHLGFNNYFEAKRSRFNVIMEAESSIDATYDKFNRNVKRNIEKALRMGIKIHMGEPDNIDLFYSMIKNKVNNSESYYGDYVKFFTGDNKIELYFAKSDPKTYVDNYRFLIKEENKNNKVITDKIQESLNKNSDKLLQNKIESDKLLVTYNEELIRATEIYSKFPDGLVVGTCAVIKNNREVYFWVEGYEEKLKDMNCSSLLRWEVIKKYLAEGYKIFNLGEVSGNRKKDNNEYYGIYFSKIGFGAELYEYPGEFDMVLNKTIYRLYYSYMSYKESKKKKKK